MVLLNEGLNKLATEFASLITQGQWGTGTTLETVGDTGLETPLASTLLNVSAVSSNNSCQFTHTIPSTTANGVALTEYELRYANGDSLNRVVGGAVNKTASFDVITISTINFVRS